MKWLLAVAAIAILPATNVEAAVCADGVYRAGCAGPNGAAVVRKPPARAYHPTCASGPNRAGCVGPRGAAVVRKPY